MVEFKASLGNLVNCPLSKQKVKNSWKCGYVMEYLLVYEALVLIPNIEDRN